jgi:hypothetical protein
VKDENGDLLADSQNILNGWKNCFSQLLNVHSISDVRQVEITAEPLVPDPSPFEVEVALQKLRDHKSPDRQHILTEMIQEGGKILLSVIHKVINSVWNEKELPDEWKNPIIVPF